jgi:surface antigen
MHYRLRAMVGAMLVATLAVPSTGAQAADASWQCAPFARMFSGIQLFGAAKSWWQQAIGKYRQDSAPSKGAVLVFKAAGSMRSGHVATVSEIVGERTIKVTHANWSPINGRRGQVERDVTVIDTSSAGDWSRVRVWYAPIKGLGTSDYPTYGFIHGDAVPGGAEVTGVAIADGAAIS